MDPLPIKINLISCGPLTHVSDIKLIRTDTTLDLSQKAEKGMPNGGVAYSFYSQTCALLFYTSSMWDLSKRRHKQYQLSQYE